MFIGMNYINGDFCPTRPDSQRAFGIFPISTENEITEAIEAADNAYLSWDCVSLESRKRILTELLTLFYSNYSYLIELIHKENINAHLIGTVDFEFSDTLQRLKRLIAIEDDLVCSNGIVSLYVDWSLGIDTCFNLLFRSLLYKNTVIWHTTIDCCLVPQTIVDLANQSELARYPGVLQLLHGDNDTIISLMDQVDSHVTINSRINDLHSFI